MKKILFLLFLFIILPLQGCKMNKRVDFILNDPKEQTENNVLFTMNWKNGISIYYFEHHAMKTSFLINMGTDLGIKNVQLESYTINIPEFEINITNLLNYEIDMTDTVLIPNSIATKRYWGGKRIEIEGLISNVIENKEQLEKFKDINNIYLIINIIYTIEGSEKRSNLVWVFTPVVKKSNAFFDKLMSV